MNDGCKPIGIAQEEAAIESPTQILQRQDSNIPPSTERTAGFAQSRNFLSIPSNNLHQH